jgi:YVTN family beta-propeller protein
MRITSALLLLMTAAWLLSSTAGPPAEQMQVGLAYGNRVLVTTNQVVDPAGRRVQFAGRPMDLAVSPAGDRVAVLLSGSLRIFTPSGQAVRTIPVNPSAGGMAFRPDGARILISQLKANGEQGIAVVDPAAAAAPAWIPLPANSAPAGIAIDSAGSFAYVALNRANLLARVDLASGLVATVPVGVAPFGVALTLDGTRLFVTNQAGSRPAAGQTTAPSAGTPILIDERGIARSGSVSVIDTGGFKVIAELPTGLLPGAVTMSPDGLLAAVANANSDSVTIFRTDTLRRDSNLPVPALPQASGSSPTAVAFNAAGDRLYVACGGNNSVAVLQRNPLRPFDRRRRSTAYSVIGAFPTDWYPMSIAAAADGTLFVANSKGIGTRNAASRFTITAWTGTMNIIDPQAIESGLTRAASDANQPFSSAALPAGAPADLHSLGIDHVFFIIKENRTYDQVLGDAGSGNSDPTLTNYGAAVTPNHHALAAQFVLLDNFFAAGTVSPDGHQWLTQAMVTPYLERAFPTFIRSYPYSGEDPLAFAPTGFLWTNAQAHGLSVRVYGEYTLAAASYPLKWADYLLDASGAMQSLTPAGSPIAALNPLVDHAYPAFALNVPDQYRARIFLDRFQQFQAANTLPNLVILQLPADHTVGVTPNSPSPNAMVADNDLAVGRIVDAISNSPYWPRSAIFITEDDAQDGVDHVDGHRTLCLVISPYTRRRAVDSTHYNHTSIVRTIEDLLGLPPMNKFDAAALPMRSVFTIKPDLTPYVAQPNQVSLLQLTPALAALSGAELRAALQSKAMNFSVPDAAPEDELNRILWHAARGWQTPFPRVPHGPGCPPEKD